MRKGGILALFFTLILLNSILVRGEENPLYREYPAPVDNTSGDDRSGFNEISIGLATISPTGLTAKFWLSRTSAFDVFGAWSFSGGKYNMKHDFNKFKIDENPMPFYYGYGVRIKDEDDKDSDIIVGIRIPLGVSYMYDGAPLDIFAEVAPRVDIAPSTNFGLDVMIGFSRIANSKSRFASFVTDY